MLKIFPRQALHLGGKNLRDPWSEGRPAVRQHLWPPSPALPQWSWSTLGLYMYMWGAWNTTTWFYRLWLGPQRNTASWWVCDWYLLIDLFVNFFRSLLKLFKTLAITLPCGIEFHELILHWVTNNFSFCLWKHKKYDILTALDKLRRKRTSCQVAADSWHSIHGCSESSSI